MHDTAFADWPDPFMVPAYSRFAGADRQTPQAGFRGGRRNMSRRSLQVLAFAGLCTFSLPAAAEPQISVFGGANWNASSDVKVSGTGTSADGTRSIDWDGGSFDLPPYWGVRGVYWLNSAPNWGFAIDYAHQKAIADLGGSAGADFSRLEFTDGNNILLFEVLYRFNPLMRGTLVPYVGAGVGVTIPHVEVTLAQTGAKTYEYQLAGAAVQILAGLEYKLNEKWSLFTEARLSYSHIEADLKGGGSLETDLWSPQIAVGLSYRF
jgi:lipid A oxidase